VARPPVPFSLYVHDIPTPSRHVQLAQYADDTALIATSGDPSLLVGYLEAYLGRLELWLRDWRIAIKVSKSTAVLFAKAARRVRQPRPVQVLREPIEWVETAGYAACLVGKRPPGEKEGSSKMGRVWPPPLQEKLSVRQEL
jgi:hypothetical protein